MNDNGPDQQLNKALIDYYCCPEAFADFALRGDLCGGEGYFRLGPDLIGYGQSSLGYYAETPAKATCDLLHHVRTEGTTCYVPFNPSAVVDNLRCERYVGGPRDKRWEAKPTTPVWELYYRLRPHLGVSIRKHLQRLWLRGWEKRRFPCWPVDRTVDRILEKLLALSMQAHRVERIPFIWFWPDGHKSCAILTHDVEESGGVDSCPALMEIDESFGLKSSFQFIPEKRYSVPPGLMELVRAKGFEVNVHDLNHDGHLYDHREEFLRRAEKINRYAKEYGARGFRAGVLYRQLDWYDAYEFSYDMSVPNVGHLDPQLGGCCTVMPYFVGKVLELPMTTVQDYTLFNIFSDYSLDLWQWQIKLITENHGLLSFNVHPDYSLEKRARDTYTALLARLSQLRRQGEVWMALPKEVDQWWRDRARMKITGEAGQWRIEGPGWERAQLAYASLAGDRISYAFDRPGEQAPGARTNSSFEPKNQATVCLRPSSQSAIISNKGSLPMPDPLLDASVPTPGHDPTRQPGVTSIAGHRARLGSARNMLFLSWVVVSVFVFWAPLRTLVDYALRRGHEFDKYSHILLIPFITIVLLYVERKGIFTKVEYSLRLGILLLLIGLALNFNVGRAGEQFGAENVLSARVFALVTVWIAGFILCYGTRAFRAGAFALLFLYLTVPIPNALLDVPLAAVQHGSADVCSLIFTLAGVPVLREGFVFSLPAVSIEVARECSGIHSTLALFIVCLLAGHFFLPPIWKKLVLILLVLPVVCVSNGLRISGLTLLAVYVDPSFLSGNLHRNGGVGFFLLALLLMYAVLYPLQREHGAKRLDPMPAESAGKVIPPPAGG